MLHDMQNSFVEIKLLVQKTFPLFENAKISARFEHWSCLWYARKLNHAPFSRKALFYRLVRFVNAYRVVNHSQFISMHNEIETNLLNRQKMPHHLVSTGNPRLFQSNIQLFIN